MSLVFAHGWRLKEALGEDFALLFFHTVFLVWFPEGLHRRTLAVGLEVSHLVAHAPQRGANGGRHRGEKMAAGGEGRSPLFP